MKSTTYYRINGNRKEHYRIDEVLSDGSYLCPLAWTFNTEAQARERLRGIIAEDVQSGRHSEQWLPPSKRRPS